MAEVVYALGAKRGKGYLYYVKGNQVWKAPLKRAGEESAAGKNELVAEGGFDREPGYLYFLDKNGDVARTPQRCGGTKGAKMKRRATK